MLVGNTQREVDKPHAASLSCQPHPTKQEGKAQEESVLTMFVMVCVLCEGKLQRTRRALCSLEFARFELVALVVKRSRGQGRVFFIVIKPP